MNESTLTASGVIRIGADRLLHDASSLIAGKRIGILTNHTGLLSDGRSTIEAIVESGLCSLRALYGPEHGITGDVPDGKVVEHALHARFRVHVYSLYGKTHKPTPQMFEGIETVVCDIQDVGARFYTFISTIALAMEAAAEQGIPFVILDRPNPIRGVSFDGPVRDPSLKSFVGWMPIPVTHGLTTGELSRLFNDEGWLSKGVKADLHVVTMEGWKRSMWYDETGLRWIPPSPNMPSLVTATVYPGLCFVEGTSISEGRGTSTPFQIIGAPWADPEKILSHIARFDLPGVHCEPDEFKPREIPGTATQPKYEGELCRGIRISVVDRNAVRPVHFGISLLAAFKRAHRDETLFRHRRFDILTGNNNIRHQLEQDVDPEEICSGWTNELEAFGRIREKYLMYS